MKKKLLIDLSSLSNIHRGLGQVAYNYGMFFKDEYTEALELEYDIYLLVPKSFIGSFGSNVKYIEAKKVYRYLPFLLPKFDVWHSIHQLTKIKPFSPQTNYLLTVHDFNFVYEKSAQKAKKHMRRIMRKLYRANAIVAISEFTKSEIVRYSNVPPEKIDVVLNGVEKMDISKAVKPTFIKSDNEDFFFTIGQVLAKKNFHVLLDLMKLFPDKKLYIAGDTRSKYAEIIKNRIKNEQISNVKLVGEVSNEGRIWLYAHCEAFLFPSLFEGFGLPVIEAMQFGKPVFSSKETSLKEIGGDCAYFWDSFEPEEMKKIIDNGLFEFKKMPELSLRNKEYALSFSYQRHFYHYFNIYHKMRN